LKDILFFIEENLSRFDGEVVSSIHIYDLLQIDCELLALTEL